MDAELTVFGKESGFSADDVEIAKLLKKRTDVILNKLIDGKYRANDPEIEGIDLDLLVFYSPKSYTGKESVEVKYIQSCENVMAYVGKWLGYNPANLSTLRFYQTLQIAKEASAKK